MLQHPNNVRFTPCTALRKVAKEKSIFAARKIWKMYFYWLKILRNFFAEHLLISILCSMFYYLRWPTKANNIKLHKN